MIVLLAQTEILSINWYATLPFWPLVGAILVGLLIALRVKAERAHWPVVLGVGVSAVLGVILFFDLAPAHEPPDASTLRGISGTIPEGEWIPHNQVSEHDVAEHATETWHDPGFTHTIYRWMSFGERISLDAESNQWMSVNFYFDGLAGVMLAFVTVVSLMVVIYSIGYMRDHHGHPEVGYERFFAFMGLFVFSMCMLVLAGNFVLLYLGWEAVGLCSYLLIGFYYKKPSAAAAAKKAFIVNRIGDFGFALGIFCLYLFLRGHVQPGENPLDYAVVFKYAHHLGATTSLWGMSQATVVALLLMCGALGKSAQFPLYVWLPDAMEGPSPVSALIHAATMVTAGIYMIARCGPIFAQSAVAMEVVLILGVIGAVLAATMAMAQYDMKRILAYSTISQLAFMFVALGCAAPNAAVFHVFTHAFFKALLFLCAGSVMHAMGGVIDVRHFSGLRHFLPWTHKLMFVGCLALAGFPFLAGFWSKDEIVHAAFVHNAAVGVIMLITAGMTAYYTFRMFFLCFNGEKRLPPEAGEHPHESPPVMIVPLVVLAVGAIFAGYVGVGGVGGSLGETFFFLQPGHGLFHSYFSSSTMALHEHGGGSTLLMYASAAVALAGIGLAWARYGKAPQKDPDAALLGPVFSLWNAKYYVDEIYDRAFVRPLRGLGRVCFGTDNYGVDGLVWFVSAVPRGIGAVLRIGQRGVLQGYAMSMIIGLVLLLLLWKWLEPVTGT
ncbi:MAG: NADH-quinone oxidoreductase subunit L [Planctomycetota bacterium]